MTMEQAIEELFEIIKDYRSDEKLMSPEIVKRWVEQFDECDRTFILQETCHLMRQRYVSREVAKNLLALRIKFLSEKRALTPVDFLKQVQIIDHQPDGKSQKILLRMFYDACLNDFGYDLEANLNLEPKYYLYVDDVLCTGDTLFKGLVKNEGDSKGFFLQTRSDGRSNLEAFVQNNSSLVLSFFCLHTKNIHKVLKRLKIGLETDIHFIYSWSEELEVDNTLNPESSFNFFIPSVNNRDQKVQDCENQIRTKLKKSTFYKDSEFVYRDNNSPQVEKFYSSSSNRERYEKIILEKCIDIYNSSSGLSNSMRPRPLGYGLQLENSLGFGAYFFTWRNVPFNTPLVFWYRSNNWDPLFMRNYIVY